MSQGGKAGRDLIQVGRDYVKSTIVNIQGGNVPLGIIQLISLFAIATILWNILTVLLNTGNFLLSMGNLTDSSFLNQGNVSICLNCTSPTVTIQGKSEKGLTYLSVGSIPVSDYKKGVTKIGENFEGSSLLMLPSKQSIKTYELPTQGTDLTIKFHKKPLERGKFAQGEVYGKVTDGTKSQSVKLEFSLPVKITD